MRNRSSAPRYEIEFRASVLLAGRHARRRRSRSPVSAGKNAYSPLMGCNKVIQNSAHERSGLFLHKVESRFESRVEVVEWDSRLREGSPRVLSETESQAETPWPEPQPRALMNIAV